VARVQAQLTARQLRLLEERNRERMAQLFSQAPIAIAMLRGPDHVYELANDGYRRLIGNRDPVGRPIREALPELAGQGVFDLLDEVYQSGLPYVGHEMSIALDRRANGSVEDASYTFLYQPVSDHSGAVDGILVLCIDVTEQVQARQRV